MTASSDTVAGTAGLPSLAELRKWAADAALDPTAVDNLLPPGRKPTNDAKRALMAMLRDNRLTDAADGHSVAVLPGGGASPAALDAGRDSAAPEGSGVAQPDATVDATAASVWRLDDLHPNETNGKVFRQSLSPAGIALLVEDIERHGQRQPIEILPDGTIIEGERRWRALRALGREFADVIVRQVDPEDVPGYVLDAFSSVREPAPEERAAVYRLALDVLRKRHGKPAGRPSKPAQFWAGFWDPRVIKKEAARRAGFSSATVAEYADRIFREADDATRAAVNEGTLSITAAYEQLRRRDAAQEPGADGPIEHAQDSVATAGDTDVLDASSHVVTAESPASEAVPGAATDTTGAASEDAAAPAATSTSSVRRPGKKPGRARANRAGAQPESKNPSPDFPTAWGAVLASVHDRDTAVRLARELADHVGVRCSFGSEDPAEAVREAAAALRGSMQDYARVDHNGASRLVKTLAKDLKQVVTESFWQAYWNWEATQHSRPQRPARAPQARRARSG